MIEKYVQAESQPARVPYGLIVDYPIFSQTQVKVQQKENEKKVWKNPERKKAVSGWLTVLLRTGLH